jgi:hypothetical protein
MIQVSAQPQTQRQLPPAGTHPARCYSIVDLGTHIKPGYQGAPDKPKHEVRFSWELPTELAVFDEEKGEQPFTVHATYTLSLGEKANLRKVLEAWRNKPFTDEELEAFDLGKVLGQPCLLSINHEKGKGDKSDRTYANIKAVTTLPKGMACPPQVNLSAEYSIAHHDDAVFDALPDWLKEIITTSEEWKSKSAPAAAPVETLAQLEAQDTIPF